MAKINVKVEDSEYTLIAASIKVVIERLQHDIHLTAVEKGWWEGGRNTGELIALIHSELSEALEADRNGNPPDDKIPSHSGLEAELADVIIRVLDMAGGLELDIAGALLAKINYNEGREYKHGKRY